MAICSNSTEELVSHIEVLLRAQKRAIKSGDMNVFEQLMPHLEVLINKVKETGEPLDDNRLTEVKSIYSEICIALETEKAITGKSIAETKKNKNLVNAYRQK